MDTYVVIVAKKYDGSILPAIFKDNSKNETVPMGHLTLEEAQSICDSINTRAT